MQNINLPRNAVNPATSENGLYVDLLKNWISELKNQLMEKNAVISYLTTQLVKTLAILTIKKNLKLAIAITLMTTMWKYVIKNQIILTAKGYPSQRKSMF